MSNRLCRFLHLTLPGTLVLATTFGQVLPAEAAAVLTIQPLTWNVVGLDSNDVGVGPNDFPVGARVCNTGDTLATNVSSSFVWDSSDTYVNTRPGSLTSLSVPSLGLGACTDFYFEVQITRNAAAYNHKRRYHITATADGLGIVSTPPPREIFVEHLISQSRNATTDVLLNGVPVPAGGTMALLLGNTYSIALVGSTATNGYNQLETFINLSNAIFQVLSVQTTYSADSSPYVSNPSDKLYGDGCLWDNDPNSPTYRSCIGFDGKVGGNITVTYQIRIIGGAGTTQTLSNLIFDFSGSSYHYNSDYSFSGRIAAIVDPTTITFTKTFTPNPSMAGGTSTLTFTLSNPNDVALSGANFTDGLPTSPGAMVVANPAGAATSNCGAPTFAPVPGAASISFSNGSLAANGTCTVSVNVTAPTAGTYDNSSGHLFIGTTDTGKTASASLIVGTTPPPPPPVCGLTLAQWTFTGMTNPPPQPSPSTQASNVASAVISLGGTSPGPVVDEADLTAGNPLPSLLTYGWPKDGPINTATFPFVEFTIDTSHYTQVRLLVDAQRKANGPNNDAVYFSSDGSTWTLKSAFTSTTSWATFGPFDFSGQTSTTDVTYFRIFGYGANTPSRGADLSLDNVTFTGCTQPQPPTILKSFSPNPIAVNGTSTLTFTLSNPNSLPLTGVTFTDGLPTGLQVAGTPAANTTCAGTPTWSPAAGSTSLTFGSPIGASIPAGSSCIAQVNLTATTAGPHTNVSGYISSTEGGTNTSPSGSTIAALTALLPPSIAKQFAPNPILVNGTSTLAFMITNPNPNDGLTGVAFTDDLPLNVTIPVPPTTSQCGGTVASALVSGRYRLTLSGGILSGGGSCTVVVDATASIAGSYLNTSENVSANLVGNGDAATDTLLVQPVHPGVSLLKRASISPTGPWTTFIAISTGASVYYQFTVENTGDVPLTAVSVTDPTLTGLGVSLASCAWANMPLFDLQTCVVGPVTGLSGAHSNTATAHGTYGSTIYDSTSSTASYATTGLTLAKSVAESYFAAPGDVLHYSYLVTNSGSAPLPDPVTVSDDRSTDESCPSVSTVGDLDAFLDSGETITCTATYTVTAGDVSAGSVTNTASATAGGVTSNTDSRTVYLNLPELRLTKADSTAGIGSPGVPFTWTLTVTNLGPLAATFNDGQPILRDPLPAGATYGSPSPGNFTNITNTANLSCSIDGSNVVTCSASGASVSVGATTGSFTVSFTALPTMVGSLPNTASVDPDGVVTETNEANNTGSDTVVILGPPSISKSFNPDPINVGDSSTLTFTLTNPNLSTGLTGVAFSDTLPAGLSVSSSSSTPCGGTLTVSAPDTIAFAGGAIPASSSCSFDVAVTGVSAGSKSNTTGAISSTNGGTGNTGSDTLIVIAPPSIAKAFAPAMIAVGGTSILTFTLTNPGGNTVALTGVGFSDTYPAGVENTTPLSTTNSCGGSLTAAPGGGSIDLSGATIPVASSCTLIVDVTSSTPGTVVNTSGSVTSINGGTGNTASDSFTAVAPPSIAKSFSPDPISVGGTSLLAFVITNPNTLTALTGVAFTDILPSGLAAAPSSSSQCGGTLTVIAPDTIALTGATIAAGGFCSFGVTVTGTSDGLKTNVSGNVTSNEGGTGNSASATLTVSAVLPPSISKSFSPVAISVGATSTVTFTLTNPAPNLVALTGVAFSDSYPAGVVNTAPLSTTNSCGGSLTGSAGAGNISLSGATIPVAGSCTVTVDVTGTTVGTKVNTSGVVTSTNGGSGNSSSDTLTVSVVSIADPAVTKTSDPATAQVGDTVTFSIVVANNGNANADNVTLTDPVPAFLDISTVTAVPSGATIGTVGNTVTVTFGTMAPGSTFTVTITTVVNSLGTPPGGTNRASVTTTSADADPANNAASATVTIVAVGRLSAPATGFAPDRTTTLPPQPLGLRYTSYGNLWIEIPALGVSTPIVGVPLTKDGWNVAWLGSQAGYLNGTAFPTWTGNSVITGHVTLPSGLPGPFHSLSSLRWGDVIVVHFGDQQYTYLVRSTSSLRPDDPLILRHEDQPWLTLVTCQGYDARNDVYRLRFVLKAVLIKFE